MRSLLRRAACAAFFVLAVSFVLPGTARAAEWCGTVGADDRPAALGGNPVRVIYAIPSDGQDGSAAAAPRISADIDQIDAWWRANDSARTPRFDLFPFPCGLQADVTLRRLGLSSTDLLASQTRFGRIAAEVRGSGVAASQTKYLVYYDGPVDDRRLCGTGGGTTSGPGVAVVYLQSCASIGSATVAAHELIHALGVMNAEVAPNECPEDLGHVCDSTGDILYPFAQPVPLTSFVLDVGRNDYYGHRLGLFDLQDSLWLRHLDAPASLSVTVSGGGTVRSNVPGVVCSDSCQSEWDAQSRMLLYAEPAEGQRFLGWSGACTGTGAGCDLTVAPTTSVSASFGRAAFRLAVSVSGRGRVTGGLPCSTRCAREMASFVPVTLRAAPAKGWRLKSWSGACRGARPTCSVPMRAAASVRAIFVRSR